MSQPREPIRWADPKSDSDPVLRRLLQNARANIGDAGLAERIERAAHTSSAADSGNEAQSLAIEPSAHTWRPWVGSAILLLGLAGATLATLRGNPAATSGTASPRIENPAATSSITNTATHNSNPLAAGTNQPVPLPRRIDPSIAQGFGFATESKNKRAAGQYALGAALERPYQAHASLAAESSDSGTANRASENTPVNHARPSRSRTALAPSTAVRSREPRSPAASELSDERRNTEATTALARDAHSNIAANSSASGARANAGTTTTPVSGARSNIAATASTNDAASIGEATATASDASGAPPPEQRAIPPELSLISAAQRALRTAPAEALALAEKHASAYPNGRFNEEREEIAISALWALGHPSAARTRAQTFLSQHPRALSAPRITRLLEASR